MLAEKFTQRHIGPRAEEIPSMLEVIGVSSLEELINQTIPLSIRPEQDMHLAEGMSEYEYFQYVRKIAAKNKLFKTYIGLGYYNTITPAVIQRNILENPSWYTSYTPYQAEISQGRLEALLNFQTAILELTGMEIANASLLDEATSAAEAMIMMFNSRSRQMEKAGAHILLADEKLFPQTLAVIETRANPLGIEVKTMPFASFEFDAQVFGAIVQYPSSDGEIFDYKSVCEKAKLTGAMVAAGADLLSLTLLTPPGEWGADIVFGSTQRFGIPMGYGGPHAGYFATMDKFKRTMPGRIIGVSKDKFDNPALRMALQVREQHIKRERATSNICTAQALLANMAGMFAVYHGPDGLKRIAENIHLLTVTLESELVKLGFKQLNSNYFDTLKIQLPAEIKSCQVQEIALAKEINLRYISDKLIGISIDQTSNLADIQVLVDIFAQAVRGHVSAELTLARNYRIDAGFIRTSAYMQQNLFSRYRSETELMRYIKKLERKDISLTHSMISLGSCTMKLNAAVEMLALSWPEFNAIHPFVPKNQVNGYTELFQDLEHDLAEITGFTGVSLQPNSGAAGEYAGLMVIREYHRHNNQAHRNVILIPSSAHGTNPASAAMAGADIVVVECDERGNIDINDLKQKALLHKENLMGFMVTYPSTHGVFESTIMEMCDIIHECGGLVYMDGANMNAQVGLTNPGTIGADVCHLNLHKTFAIPHGGGGPGVGPICVAKYLVDFLPSHPVVKTGGMFGAKAISAAPYGSASVMVITHSYIKMLGKSGLTESTKMAILNANYIASALKNEFQVLYTGETNRVAHEMIFECRNFKNLAHITETDIAKRLMDYGFHAPTLSFPVHGTLMIEPTESESKQELDKFIAALKQIHAEIMEVAEGKADAEDNVLKNAPHTQAEVCSSNWNHAYDREKAAFPLHWVAENKFWPGASRVDDAYGDRNLVCSCTPIDAYR